MAVKIIKEGEPPSVTKTCEVCGCEFSFDCRDVEYNSICSTEGFMGKRYYIICPCCNKREIVTEDDSIKLKLYHFD